MFERCFRSKIKEKCFFSLYFARLFVPLQPKLKSYEKKDLSVLGSYE